jgi:hypothetical protein
MTRAHMQLGEDSRRLGNRHRAKEAAGWAEVGPGRPAQPISRPSQPPFDLAAIRLLIAPSPGATHQLIRHPPTRSREERDTISERRGSG